MSCTPESPVVGLTVDRVLCINHPEAELRRQTMDQRFRSQRMTVELFPGVIARPDEEKYFACLRAHQNAVRAMKQLGAKNVLIFEDDVVFLKTWSWIKAALRDVPEDYDIVRLCVITDGAYTRKHIKAQVFRCWAAYGTQCYLLNAKAFDTVLSFPETDPYDSQLDEAGLVQYSIHPLPVFHELGSSLLGNAWLQTRDDLVSEPMNRETAVLVIDTALNELQAPVNIHLRIEQCLAVLRDQPQTQELRFLKTILDRVSVSRADAKRIAHAYFVLSTRELGDAST